MTMTEPTTAPKPARKVAKRRKRRAAAPATKREPKPAPVPAEFAGLTATACCDECRVDRCVITEIGICGHPLKGGLQPPLMVRPAVVERYNRAKKAMAHARIDEKNVL